MYFIYILISLDFPKTYTGIAENPEKRLAEHNSGKSFYTKQYLPWMLIYLEEALNAEGARKREKYLKSAAGRRWINKNLFN